MGILAGSSLSANELTKIPKPGFFEEEAKKLPARHFDVVVAAADYSEPNDHAIVNSIGLANVDIEKYYNFLASQDALHQLAY